MDTVTQGILADSGRQIADDAGKGMLVGGLPGALVGATIGVVGSKAFSQGQATAARFSVAKDGKAHLGGGLAYNVLHKYSGLSRVAQWEDRYDKANEAAAEREFTTANASNHGASQSPLFDVWGTLCLTGSEILDAGSNFASLMSFAAELLGTGLVLATAGAMLPASAVIEEMGKTVGLVSDGLGLEAEVAKGEYLSYRAAKVDLKNPAEKAEVLKQIEENSTDTLGSIGSTILDLFQLIHIPKTLNFGKLKKSAAMFGKAPGWIRGAEKFAARAAGPLLQFASRMKPWLLSIKKVSHVAYKILDWAHKIWSAYGDARKFLDNTGNLAKQMGHGAGLAYRGAKRLGGQAIGIAKHEIGAAKSAGLKAWHYAEGKAHTAGHLAL